MMRCVLQLSVRWPCNIWLVGRMKFASLVTTGLLSYPILLFSLSVRSPDMTEKLLAGTINLNSIITSQVSQFTTL